MHCLDGSLEIGVEVPDVSLGLKSVLFVELIARGPRTDVHSLNAPLVPNPVWDLVHALATIMDRNKNILIPDWAEGIYEPDDEDMGYLADKAARIDFDMLKDEMGVDAFALGRDGVDALKARTYEPTANIQGITGGYTGKGTKTIVPSEARVRMDFRLIPNISPAKAIVKLRDHLKAQGFDNIEVKGEPRTEDPYKISAREDISVSIIAAAHVGIKAEQSAQALNRFRSPKRRMELLGEHRGVKVFDDFAHHPSAIKTTVSGLRQHQPDSRIIAVLEPRSNTMKMGVHSDTLVQSLEDADNVFVLQPEGLKWQLAEKMPKAHVFESTDDLLAGLLAEVRAGDAVLIMSNGSFDGLHQRFLKALQ